MFANTADHVALRSVMFSGGCKVLYSAENACMWMNRPNTVSCVTIQTALNVVRFTKCALQPWRKIWLLDLEATCDPES